jgi:hypothetical protein
VYRVLTINVGSTARASRSLLSNWLSVTSVNGQPFSSDPFAVNQALVPGSANQNLASQAPPSYEPTYSHIKPDNMGWEF